MPKHLQLSLLFAFLALASTAVGADVVLQVWSMRDKFPALNEVRDFIKDGTAIDVAIIGEDYKLHTNGRASHEEKFNWAPILVYTAKDDQTVAVGGVLDLYSGSKDAKAPVVTWAVVKWTVGATEFTVIATGQAHGGDQIDFATDEKLEKISLKKDERLGITAWRHAWHWYGGAIWRNSTIKLVD